ncbi:hypothetical protein FJZ31_13530 [Candidatus Poribacteria bacterium]|nr:hypothetical protein [Candidatus Poribacteria bacterium]
MDRDGDIARVKKVILDGLKRFKPAVQIEQSPTSGSLHVWVISDAFEKYSDFKRMDIVGQVLEKALANDPVYPNITRLFPLTKEEFVEDEIHKIFHRNKQI